MPLKKLDHVRSTGVRQLVRRDQISSSRSEKYNSVDTSRPAPISASPLCKMQKVIRRTILAEKQAARRLEKKRDTNDREWRKSNREQNTSNRKDVTKEIKKRRAERREDWELGPLAPRRDVGDQKDTFGTVSGQRTRGPIIEYGKRKEVLESVGGRYPTLVKGDRVVLLEGRDKGKIGTVMSTDRSRAECKVEGLNMV
jgi:large subunit ribosomal protein L24